MEDSVQLINGPLHASHIQVPFDLSLRFKERVKDESAPNGEKTVIHTYQLSRIAIYGGTTNEEQ